MARPLQQRFEKFVDRRGEHHVWTGAKRPGLGTGRMRIEGKEVPAHRIAWELAHGPLGDGGRVLPCPDEPACVRLEHLTVDALNAVPGKGPKKRGRKGGGSMREVRDGVWELSVMSSPSSDRRPERLYRRVEVPSAAAAARENSQRSSRRFALVGLPPRRTCAESH